MTADELARVEALVNAWVADASPTSTREMDLDAARAAGATAMFGEKYDDVVRVVDVPGVSMELCGGERQRQGARCWLSSMGPRGRKRDARALTVAAPACLPANTAGTHVGNTSEIGAFKVVSESGVASGVRRIEAVAGAAAVEYLQSLDGVVKALAANLKVKADDLPARVAALQVCARRRGC